MASCRLSMKHGGRQLKIESNYKGMLRRVFESVDNEINTVAIAKSQTNDSSVSQVRKSRDCAACDIGQCVCWTRC